MTIEHLMFDHTYTQAYIFTFLTSYPFHGLNYGLIHNVHATYLNTCF